MHWGRRVLRKIFANNFAASRWMEAKILLQMDLGTNTKHCQGPSTLYISTLLIFVSSKNLIKIGQIFTDLLHFAEIQYGLCPTSWILFRHGRPHTLTTGLSQSSILLGSGNESRLRPGTYSRKSIRQVYATLLGERNGIKVCLKILPRFDIWSVRYCNFNHLLIWLKSAY